MSAHEVSSFSDIDVRTRAKAWAAGPAQRARRFADKERARKLANLKAEGFVVPLSEWLGHNNGPAWDEWAAFVAYCWRRAHEKAWTPPTLEIAARRARKAQALGLTYRQYVLEILERGRYPNEEALTSAPTAECPTC
jgi:hypothetical protein